MTITFSLGNEPPVDMLAQVEDLYQHTAETLILAVNDIKAGKFEKSTVAAQSVRDLKSAYFWVMEERGKVDKLRKQAAGVLGTGQLDLHAARDEIGRRLARLRDAAAG